MRLSSEEAIVAAAEAGITVFDTARAYGESERILGGALRRLGAPARVVTKGGMREGWVPDGRARSIRADCLKSLDELGVPIDLYLLHAPDPRTPWPTQVRALARLVDDRLVARVGLSNVNRPQLDAALEIAPIAAVQVALSRFDDRALRGGMVARCEELGISLIAHSPLGGPRRARKLSTAEAEQALAWLLALGPHVVAIPGATRAETARSAARAATLAPQIPQQLQAEAAPRTKGEVVLIMGIPGAGKSRLAQDWVARDYQRLNRDERGGSLKALAETLDDQLSAGATQVVLDNTYLTRAARNHVIDAAHRHGLAARCIWLDIPLAQAQINLVERLLDHFGEPPTPQQLRDNRLPGLLSPTSQMRTLRELEPPTQDEGWDAVEQIAFVRKPRQGKAAVFVAAAAVTADFRRTGDRHLVFDWDPEGNRDRLDAALERVGGDAEAALCPHPAGPPQCWCRPPLPGLMLAFARKHGIDPARSLVIGAGPAHRTLADALGARYGR
jgi:aryl-alcohol dehydrogenase-like predicted oxidoreductase